MHVNTPPRNLSRAADESDSRLTSSHEFGAVRPQHRRNRLLNLLSNKRRGPSLTELRHCADEGNKEFCPLTNKSCSFGTQGFWLLTIDFVITNLDLYAQIYSSVLKLGRINTLFWFWIVNSD